MSYSASINFGTQLARVVSINAKNTGQTTLFTVPTSQNLIVTSVIVRLTAASGVTIQPIVSFGKTGALTDWVSAAGLPVGLSSVGSWADMSNSAISLVRASYTAGDQFKIDIATGATATTYTIECFVFGFLF